MATTKLLIRDVEVIPLTMRLAEPFVIATESYERVVNVFLRVVGREGLVGLGVAAPSECVTGESPERAAALLRDVAAPRLRGSDALARGLLLHELGARLAAAPSALAAVDMALHDLVAKRAGLPLVDFLGRLRTHMPTSMTIGILPDDEVLERARAHVGEGFRALKVKGGLDLERDVRVLLALRAALGPKIELRFDANQGYGVEEALSFVPRVREARVAVLEQPTRAARLDLLSRVARSSSVPVMADEAVVSVGDAFRLARGRLADMVNVKLAKVGGIAPAKRADAIAGAAGLPVMVGSMDESALAIAAGLAFALSSANVRRADLDGHIGLGGDPAEGLLRLERGALYPREGPGLGLEDIG